MKEFFKALYISVKDNGKAVLVGYPKVSFVLFAAGFVVGALLL